MSFLITVQYLVDEFTAEEAESAVTDAANHASNIIDFQISATNPLSAHIADAIVNDTYKKGDAFLPMVAFNADNFSTGDAPLFVQAFWSKEYGWVNYDLATRFDATLNDVPDGSVMLIDDGPQSMVSALERM